MQRLVLICIAVLFAGFSAACGARQAKPDAIDTALARGDVATIDMEPLVIRAHVGPDGDVQTTSVDLRNLFDEATAYYQADDFVNAIRLYQVVLDATDEEIWSKAAMYNSGLAWEGLGAWEEAAQTFDDIIRFFPTSKEARDAHFRLGEALAWLGEFQRIPSLMTAALQRPDLTLDRRLEALVRSGTAYFELRKFSDAEAKLQQALLLDESSRAEDLREGRRVERGRVAVSAMAQANFLLGRVYHEIFLEVRMVLPVERYKKDLADKQRLYEQAIDWYTRAVRTGNNYWAPQAGFMIGKLYEDYYFDILASEVPATFTAEQHQIYFDAMREFLAPGLQRAIEMYEQALGMSYRMGSQDDVVDLLLDTVERLKRYREEKLGWEEEHQQIIAGTHPRSPRPASGMVFRHEVTNQ